MPGDLVEKIHNINVLEHRARVNSEFMERIGYHATGYQTTSGDNCLPKFIRASYYELVVDCPRHKIKKRVTYANGSIDDNGLWTSVLHISTFLDSEKIGGRVKIGEQTLLNNPINNNTVMLWA